jgi:hypothetical protein
VQKALPGHEQTDDEQMVAWGACDREIDEQAIV